MSSPTGKQLAAGVEASEWTQVLVLAGETESLGPKEILGILEGVKKLLLTSSETDSESAMLVSAFCKVIAAQARHIIELTEEQGSLQRNVEAMATRLSEAFEIQRSLKVRAQTDTLTGLRNQGTFRETAPKMFEYCKDKGRKLSYVIIDLDHFKQINDIFGHAGGDFVLQELSKILDGIRPTDFSFRMEDEQPVVARDGGEEFSLLLPNTPIDGATNLAERIRRKVEGHEFCYEHPSRGRVRIPVRVSIGVAEVDYERDSEFKVTKEHADQALYRAKNGGRNAVFQFGGSKKGRDQFSRVTPEVRVVQ